MILFCAHVCLQTAATCASLCHTCALVSPSSHPNTHSSHSVSQIQLQGSSPGDLLNKRWKIKVEAVILFYSTDTLRHS